MACVVDGVLCVLAVYRLLYSVGGLGIAVSCDVMTFMILWLIAHSGCG